MFCCNKYSGVNTTGVPSSQPALNAAPAQSSGRGSKRCGKSTARCQPFRYGFIGGPSQITGAGVINVTVRSANSLLQYVEVGLYGQNNIYRTGVTDASGTVTFSSLPAGRYQINACGCCKQLCLLEGQTQGFIFCCPCATCIGNVYISLYSGSNGKPLQYGVFGIYNTNGRLVARGTTNADGQLALYSLPCARYELRQLSAPPLYNDTGLSRLFTLSENNFSIRVYNTLAQPDYVAETLYI